MSVLTAAQVASIQSALAGTLNTTATIYRLGVSQGTVACRMNNGKHFALAANSTLRGRFNWVFRFAAGVNVAKGDVLHVGASAQYEVKDVDGAFPDGLSLIALAEQVA